MDPVKQRDILEAFAIACETNNLEEISRAWSHYFHDLNGARGVFVVNEPTHDVHSLPSNESFEGGCFLCGYLKSRRLALLQNAGSSRPFSYASHLFADTNFVSYCRSAFSGKSLGSVSRAFYAAGDYLMGKRDELDPVCYLIENFERRHLPEVRDRIKAFTAFRLADAETFRRDRSICPTVSEAELEAMTTRNMARVDGVHFRTLYAHMKQKYLLNLLALTKMAAIALGSDVRKSAEEKLLKLLEYFDREVAMVPKVELIAAWRFYDHKAHDPFFGSVQRNSRDLLDKIDSTAWDLAHWRNAMTLVTVTGHLGIHASFPIPYFLTFDRRYADLLSKMQLNGIICSGEGYIPIHDMATERSLTDSLEEAKELLKPDAVSDRRRRRPADDLLTSHFEQLVQSARQELCTALNLHGPN